MFQYHKKSFPALVLLLAFAFAPVWAQSNGKMATLLHPADHDTLDHSCPVFTWAPSLPISPGESYWLDIFEVHPGQTALAAVSSNPHFYSSLQSTTMMPYPPSAPSLQAGGHYAWRVVTEFRTDAGEGVSPQTAVSDIFEFYLPLDTAPPVCLSYPLPGIFHREFIVINASVIHFDEGPVFDSLSDWSVKIVEDADTVAIVSDVTIYRDQQGKYYVPLRRYRHFRSAASRNKFHRVLFQRAGESRSLRFFYKD